jgi:hypothetical protein
MKRLCWFVCVFSLALSVAAQNTSTHKSAAPAKAASFLKLADGGGSCSIGGTGYCSACSVSCKPGQSAECVPGQIQCDVVMGCKCVVQSKCYCGGKASQAETKARQEFGTLQQKKLAGTLSDTQDKELLGLARKLGMVRKSASKYCYCEENNYACNPDNPWPGCTCTCTDTNSGKKTK